MKKNLLLVAPIVLLTGCASTSGMLAASMFAPKMNPELANAPTFSDQKLTQLQAKLIDQQQALAANQYQLPTKEPVACNLQPDVLWRLAHGVESKAAYLKRREGYLSQNPAGMEMTFEVNDINGSLLSGRCQNGKPEGAFEIQLAEGDKTTVNYNGVTVVTANQKNSIYKGTMTRGQLDGESSFSSIVSTQSNDTSSTTYVHGIGQYQRNLAKDSSLVMSWSMPSPINKNNFQLLTSTITHHKGNGNSTSQSYSGSILVTESSTQNFKTHGLVTSHPYVFFTSMPASGGSRQCYQNGKLQSSLSPCGIKDSKPETPSSGLIGANIGTKAAASLTNNKQTSTISSGQASFIANSSGLFLSPITSDGVAAEWVEKSISVGLGSSLGGAAGAYAGQKALENVPFVGGFLGQRAGAALGRKVALEGIGGEAYMRETTDISFNSVQEMATWLKRNHATHPRMGEILKATAKIYPELPVAYASVR